MSIYWGSTEIVDGKLTLGDQTVTAVYYGPVQIWPPDVGPIDQGPRVLEDGVDNRALEDGVDTRITEGGP